MLGIIDYGMGNLLSVCHAIKSLGKEVMICRHPEELSLVSKIVLPGVGAFPQCMQTLQATGFFQALENAVIKQGKYILGICLGMQVMAKKSFEGGEVAGFGWIDADVVRLLPTDKKLTVPHVGWNKITYQEDCALFSGLAKESANFYFTHSYHLQCNNAQDIKATCQYGEEVAVAINKDNIYAVQFHPEKSQDAGLKLLENFIKLDV